MLGEEYLIALLYIFSHLGVPVAKDGGKSKKWEIPFEKKKGHISSVKQKCFYYSKRAYGIKG